MAFDMQEFFKNYGGGLASLGGGIAGLFGKAGKNPSDAAMGYLNQIPGQTKPYYQPYMDAGKGALSNLQNEDGDLLNGTKQNQLGENYKQSPGYQFALQQALQGSNNAAAMGGNLGMPQHEQSNMETAQGLASQDYNNYMQNQMGLYGQGLQGNQGLNQMGYNANTGYADMMAQLLGTQGQYGAAGADWKNTQNKNNWANIFGGLGSLFGGGRQ